LAGQPAIEGRFMNLSVLREQFVQNGLHERDMHYDPVQQFRTWFDLACSLPLPQAEAMTLATSTPDGTPSARVVLLRGFDELGFVFFTNYESRKGRELASNPRAALVFFWSEIDRQVRVEGEVERTSARESDAYFAGRPLGSQLSAWISDQSEAVDSREVLEQNLREIRQKYPNGKVPRPPHWGGFRLVPHTIEFWQGRPDRLHDRLCYQRQADGGWQLKRLAP
jgi:pyridoxamine 5'-phosphate oxidase